MAFDPKEVADIHQSMKKLLEIWMKIKLVIQRAFGKDPITKEHEVVFRDLKRELSRVHRAVADRLPKDLQFSDDQMLDMMKTRPRCSSSTPSPSPKNATSSSVGTMSMSE